MPDEKKQTRGDRPLTVPPVSDGTTTSASNDMSFSSWLDQEFQYFERVRGLRLHPYPGVERTALFALYHQIQRHFERWGQEIHVMLRELREDLVLSVPPESPKHLPRHIALTWIRKSKESAQEPALYVALREEGLEVGFGFGLRKSQVDSPVWQKFMSQIQRFHRKSGRYLSILQQRDYRCWPRPFLPFHEPGMRTEDWLQTGGVVVRLLKREELQDSGVSWSSWLAQILGELMGWFGFLDRVYTQIPHVRPLHGTWSDDLPYPPDDDVFSAPSSLQSLMLDFQQYARSHQLDFSMDTIRSYLLALQTRPLVILSGAPGTGKSKLALLFSQFLTQDAQTEQGNPHLVFLPVRPDWLDPRPLLGYYDTLAYTYRSTPFLELLLRAHHHPDAPYFVILDEMNLSRIEYYLADILSLLESRIYPASGPVLQQSLSFHTHQEPILLQDPYQQWLSLPAQFAMPTNVYITGTVNIDETAHRISPKVLDRANLLEMTGLSPSRFLHQLYVEPSIHPKKRTVVTIMRQRSAFCREGAFTAPYHAEQLTLSPEYLADLASALEAFAQALAPTGLSVGPRTLQEIVDFGENLARLHAPHPPDFLWWLDHQLLQKILPRVYGSRQLLQHPLGRLLLLCWPERNLPHERTRILQEIPDPVAIHQAMERCQLPPTHFPHIHPLSPPDLPLSAGKITRMLDTLRHQSYVS